MQVAEGAVPTLGSEIVGAEQEAQHATIVELQIAIVVAVYL